MELGSVIRFLENRTILITGATGFLAKIFVEKILRVQPNVKKLYLLIRATDTKSASQRLHNEVISKDLFRVLKEKMEDIWTSFLSEKVVPVAGDITFENLGVKDTDLLEDMWGEVEVVVNIAATVNFDERYDVSLHLNTFGAKNVLNFSKKCVNLKGLLHVSTAYVSGEREGLILEDRYNMGETLNGISKLDIEMESKIVEHKLNELKATRASEQETTMAMKDLGLERAKRHGWPNTYVFTKAMGEMLLGHLKENIPLVILRPTIITSTYREPFPGWVEGVRTIDSLAVGYGKGKLTCFLGDPNSIVDTIPADMVVNAMIVAMAAQVKDPHDEATIYHVGSSVANPLKLSSFQDYGLRYFSKHPWVGKDGKPIIVGPLTVLNSMESFNRYMTLWYLLPLKVLQSINIACCQYFRTTYQNLNRKISFVLRLVELYRPYLFSKSIYDDINTRKLQTKAREGGVEIDVFYFDPKIIDWDDYFLNIHVPGLIKYVFK